MSSLIQMTPKQRIRANKLIRRMCANFMDGECVCLDCECPQIISYSLLCKYFKRAVLPLDKELEAEVFNNRISKSLCQRCGMVFTPSNNSQKYCVECRKNVCREQARLRKQKQRSMSRDRC